MRHRILFVCLGNICRSPMAEGVFRRTIAEAGLEEAFAIDSAGTGDWHIGHPPDERARAAAAARGIDISHLRARQVCPADFDRFDMLLAMDRDNRESLLVMAPSQSDARKVHLFLDFAPEAGASEVPDPYYGGRRGFETVLDLIEQASRGLLTHLEAGAPTPR